MSSLPGSSAIVSGKKAGRLDAITAQPTPTQSTWGQRRSTREEVLKSQSMGLRGILIATMLGATALTSGAQAADKIRIMVGGLEKQIYLPFMLTQRLGYFTEQGLDVELLSEPSGVDAEDEMLAGAGRWRLL